MVSPGTKRGPVNVFWLWVLYSMAMAHAMIGLLVASALIMQTAMKAIDLACWVEDRIL